MLSASKNIISHDKIINVMTKVGHKGIKEGVCNGLAQMYTQAIFCEETEKFISRLYFICETPDLEQKINAAKAKKGRHLSEDDQACLDVLAFFEGVQLYQNFHFHTHLLDNKPHHLDAAAIATLTDPIKLANHPIVEIYSENRLFNKASLQRYLNVLAVEFELYDKNRMALASIKQPTTELIIALHSCTHKIILRRNTRTAHWELTDANQYTPFDLPHETAAEAILLALTEGTVAPVNISIFTTDDNILKNVMGTILAKLKNTNLINTSSANAMTSKKTHLLTLTAMRGDEETFLKIAKKIPNHALWEYMLSASKTAMYHGQTNIMNIIIEQYPDCVMTANDTAEFLTMAITNRQTELIKKIVAAGADVDEAMNDQRPLHIAICIDNIDAVKELIALGANINLKNKDDDNPLFLAIKLHKISIIDYLCKLKATNINDTNKNGDTPLIAAVRENSSAACEILLGHQADPDKQNNMGETAAILACSLNHHHCLNMLIKYGANLNLFDMTGRTPVTVSLIKQNWDMCATLLLNLKNLESFNSFSYQLTINYLRDIIRCVSEQLSVLNDYKKKVVKSDIKHHRGALGMILMKNPKADFCVFFKPAEKKRKAYLKEIYTACKPTPPLDVDSHSGYIRL